MLDIAFTNFPNTLPGRIWSWFFFISFSQLILSWYNCFLSIHVQGTEDIYVKHIDFCFFPICDCYLFFVSLYWHHQFHGSFSPSSFPFWKSSKHNESNSIAYILNEFCTEICATMLNFRTKYCNSYNYSMCGREAERVELNRKSPVHCAVLLTLARPPNVSKTKQSFFHSVYENRSDPKIRYIVIFRKKIVVFSVDLLCLLYYMVISLAFTVHVLVYVLGTNLTRKGEKKLQLEKVKKVFIEIYALCDRQFRLNNLFSRSNT